MHAFNSPSDSYYLLLISETMNRRFARPFIFPYSFTFLPLFDMLILYSLFRCVWYYILFILSVSICCWVQQIVQLNQQHLKSNKNDGEKTGHKTISHIQNHSFELRLTLMFLLSAYINEMMMMMQTMYIVDIPSRHSHSYNAHRVRSGSFFFVLPSFVFACGWVYASMCMRLLCLRFKLSLYFFRPILAYQGRHPFNSSPTLSSSVVNIVYFTRIRCVFLHFLGFQSMGITTEMWKQWAHQCRESVPDIKCCFVNSDAHQSISGCEYTQRDKKNETIPVT